MIVAINYANVKYRQTQNFNTNTAIRKGKVDRVISYFPKDMDMEFRRKNISILCQERGNGYWLWKPYFILKTLESLQENDYLIYLDSGAFYINDVRHLIRQMDSDAQYIMAFELPFKEYCYTKRDVFVCMDCDEFRYVNTNQRMATMVIIKRTDESLRFVREWLKYGQAENIITDAKNHLGKDNYDGFIDNRHDQSIFSLLTKKYGIKAYRDPSQFGRFPEIIWRRKIEQLEDSSDYPQIVAKHGWTKITKRVFAEQMLLAYAPKSIVNWYVHSKFYFSMKRTGERIAILTDNMPIKDNSYGYGMYKVVHRLTKALGDHVDTVICTDKNYCEDKVDYSIEDKLVLANKFHHIKMANLKNLFFLFELFSIVCELRYKKVKKIFIPLGADYNELKRAYLLSVFYHMPVSIYIVDDFIEYDRNFVGTIKHSGIFEKRIIRYIKQADQIFVISEGMRDRIFALTKRRSVILPLPYEWKELNVSERKSKRQIMFIGSISSLYMQGVKDIAAVIDQINTEIDQPIYLMFTYSVAAEVRKIIGNYKCVCSRRMETEKQLREEMHDSLFCFMPYSDNMKLQLMQSTSFPSKLTEYLSSARSIVIYGNCENSAKRYFEENNLPQVICGRNKDLLRQCIIEHIKEEKDYSNKYICILKKNHSFKMTKKKILQYIQGESK